MPVWTFPDVSAAWRAGASRVTGIADHRDAGLGGGCYRRQEPKRGGYKVTWRETGSRAPTRSRGGAPAAQALSTPPAIPFPLAFD